MVDSRAACAAARAFDKSVVLKVEADEAEEGKGLDGVEPGAVVADGVLCAVEEVEEVDGTGVKGADGAAAAGRGREGVV